MNVPSEAQQRSSRLAIWLIIPLTVALVLILLVFYGLYRTTTVDGESMLPTLRPEDRVLVTKSYGEPRRGDVVVVNIPDSRGHSHDLVKRVVAVGGDVVSVAQDVLYVNGQREGSPDVIVDPSDGANVSEMPIPAGTVFLLGDNRPVSYDSRFFGPVPVTDVQGKVVAVFAPVTRLSAVR